MATKNCVAFDMGASNGRAIVGQFDGSCIHLDVVHKFENKPARVGTSDFWNVFGFLAEIETGLAKAAKAADGAIASMGVDTWGVDYGLLDRADRLMSVPYHYRDSRTDGLLDEIFDLIPRQEIYGQTGIQFMQLNTLVQLYAEVKYRPWILQHAESLLFMPDLLAFFLTGEKYNEYTIASTSQLFDPRKSTWAKPLFSALGIPMKIMRPMIFPGQQIGVLAEHLQKECRIDASLPVVAVGGHDTASAVAAAPLTDPQSNVYISSGTWSLIGMELEQPLINEQTLAANFTNECGLARRIRFLKNLGGLWLIQQCKRSWARSGIELTYPEITAGAAKAKPFLFRVDPEDPRFLNPEDMVVAIQDACRESGQIVPEDPFDIARGIYESLAFGYKDTIRQIESLTGKTTDAVHIVGGGINAELVNQYTADLTGKLVVAGPEEATAFGNILAQLMYHGEIASLEEGREIVRNSYSLKEYNPTKR